MKAKLYLHSLYNLGSLLMAYNAVAVGLTMKIIQIALMLLELWVLVMKLVLVLDKYTFIMIQK